MHTQSTLRRTTSTHFLRFFPSWFAVALLLLTALGLQCGQTPSGGTTQALQLALSPSLPQIAQGTGQQFQLRGLQDDGHILELSCNGKWTVQAPDGEVLPSPQAGLVELTTPGRYQVAVEYAGQTVRTELLVTTATLSTLSISPTLPKVAKRLTQQFKVTATFSDGTTQDVYQQYRVGGQLSKVLEGARNIVKWKKELKSAKPFVVFQFLVVKPNEHQIEEVKALAKEIGVDDVWFKTAQIYDYEKEPVEWDWCGGFAVGRRGPDRCCGSGIADHVRGQ